MKFGDSMKKAFGFTVYYIPQDFSECETAENALWHIPKQETLTLAIWIGYIPFPERYKDLYDAALAKNIKIINAPDDYRLAMEFDRFYSKIKHLTFKSEIFDSVDNMINSDIHLEYPLFIKGTIQSLKSEGIGSCVANNEDELKKISQRIIKLKRRSLGKIIVREYKPLKHVRTSGLGFPIGREYRVFMYHNNILEYGYYWEDRDDLSDVTREEENIIFSLCREVSKSVNVPYLSIDIGQKENNEWTVIELGDAQFSGTSQIPLQKLAYPSGRASPGSTSFRSCGRPPD
ncbi:MAG: ATP-grasp domain-containing protein [bacterium]|nr:ATP-grasp domain-containing protein [bacterium]